MKKKNVSFRRYFGIFSDVKIPWLIFAGIIAITLVSYYVSMSAIWVSGEVIDASGYVDTDLLVRYFVPMGIAVFANVIITMLTGVGAEKVNLGLRQKMWRKMMFLPNASYDKDNGEALVSRVTTDCDNASQIFTVVLSCFSIFIGIFIYLREMFLANTTMSLYTMLIIPVGVVIGWLYGKARYWAGSRTQGALSGATAYLIERTRNINLIRAASTQETEAAIGNEKFKAQYGAELWLGLLSSLYSLISGLLSPICQAIVFVFGAGLVANGKLTVGEVVVFYSFASSISLSFSNLILYFGRVKQSVGALDQVVEILETGSEDLNKGVQADLPDTDIEVRDVAFGYNDEKEVLNGITCTIPKGKVTAVIGANGSGKSTLFKLLERFYAPEKGAILFGGRNAQDYSLSSWRRAMGYVPQDCGVMEGTIRSNIAYGTDHPVTDEELKKAARMANLTALVESLPDGFDSYVAPGGRNFSGGQRQCIAIARAIMRNPDYLLLDEATSALDTRSRRVVTDALHNLMKGRTTVMIAHDLASIRHADNVIVIKEGKVDACGSPAEIIKTSEMYRQFVMDQSAAPAV